jgi:sucrose hydrolase-like protein
MLHNFSDADATVQLDVGTPDGGVLCDYFDQDHTREANSGRNEIRLGPYRHKW